MKLIIGFLTVCGLVAAQPAQAPSPVQQSTRNATRAVEGYTDSVGGDDYNQRLSERRGSAVRAYYLTQSGMAPASVTT